MKKLNFGDVVLLCFPFSNYQTVKKRPALVIKDTDDGDIIVCRITSKIYKSSYDIELVDWENCGLKLPSIIRVHKIATMENEMVEQIMGCINSKTKKSVKELIAKLID